MRWEPVQHIHLHTHSQSRSHSRVTRVMQFKLPDGSVNCNEHNGFWSKLFRRCLLLVVFHMTHNDRFTQNTMDEIHVNEI